MVKNKRQKDPAGNESTGSSDDEKKAELGASRACSHVGKCVNITQVRKALLKDPALEECQQCNQKKEEEEEDPDFEKPGVWMCLRCGHRGCDRSSRHKHALAHVNAARSDPHGMAVSTVGWNVWCYSCDEQVNPTANRKLQECVDFIRKQAGIPRKAVLLNGMSVPFESNIPASSGAERMDPIMEKDEKNAKNMQSALEGAIPKVKGLGNLGNTCFLNAVLQSLSQTHFLNQVLTTQWGQKLHLPGLKDNQDSVPSLEVTLPEAGPLTTSLACLLKDMAAHGHNRAAHVGQLFAQVSRRSPQFRGFQQQDSHELLRHLLDGIKTEEIRRYKTGILRSLDLTEKVDPRTVSEETRRRIKMYGQQATQTLVDAIFGGHILSTVICKECTKASQVLEPFMDLSLPTIEEKSPPRSHRKAGKEVAVVAERKGGSGRKAGRRDGKKNAGRRARQKKESSVDSNRECVQTVENGEPDDGKSESDDSDADIEDNEDELFGHTLEEARERLSSLNLDGGDDVRDDEEEAWSVRSQQTLSSRYQSQHGECSVQSCLNQLTMAELLTGTNRFGCENCTKKSGGREKDLVRTICSKQMLVLSPPAVLTLHLKRFQQCGNGGLRKVNRHVAFPLTLDLSPFCSQVCLGLPTMRRNQQKILYSLYAVVEHSGTLSGGHYIAYVKARLAEPVKRRVCFLNIHPLPQRRDSKSLAKEMLGQDWVRPEVSSEPDEAVGGDDDVGRWYHVSDSMVREVMEEKVLRSQAYLLFYERIL